MTLDNQIREHLREAERERQERLAKEIIDAQTKIISAAYDKAIAYTNLIIIAGYASFFAMWSFTREHLSPPLVLWAALIMSVSIVSFIFFEVYKMFITSKSLLFLDIARSDPEVLRDPNKILEKTQEREKLVREMTMKLGRVWYPVLFVTVSTALIAIGIMFYAFLNALIKEYWQLGSPPP